MLAVAPPTPKAVLSDNGMEFRGKAFESLIHSYGIHHDYSVPYVASTNGCVEQFNRTLRSKLATVCHGKTNSWCKKLYQVVSQYNRTPHSETGKAPSEYFVQEPRIIVPSKKYWKAPRKFNPFHVVDLVLRKIPTKAAGQRDKLGPRYQGPLRIIEADTSGVTYRAKFLTGAKKTVQVHISQIKKFHGKYEEPVMPAPATKELANLPKPGVRTPVSNQWDVFDLP